MLEERKAKGSVAIACRDMRYALVQRDALLRLSRRRQLLRQAVDGSGPGLSTSRSRYGIERDRDEGCALKAVEAPAIWEACASDPSAAGAEAMNGRAGLVLAGALGSLEQFRNTIDSIRNAASTPEDLRIASLEGLEDALQKTLELEGAAVFILGAGGNLIHASRMAQDLCPGYFTVIDDRIVPDNSRERARFQSMIDDALASGSDRGRVPRACLVTGADGSRAALRAIPITPASRKAIGFGDSAKVLLLASPVTSRRNIDPALIRDVFELSLGEARLAALIGGGYTLQDAAIQLGIAEGTARVVLKNVFRKLGINRQAELILQLSSLARGSAGVGAATPRATDTEQLLELLL